MRRTLRLCAALSVSLLCACAGHRAKGSSEADGLAAAMRTVTTYRGASYKLGPSDLLSVTVYPDATLNRKERIDADGKISLPLVGTVSVAGATVLEAQAAVEKQLASYLKNPHVTLFVEEYGNRQLFVLGEVKNPGSYAIPAGARLTALQAVTTAGGFTKVAAPKRAHVLRLVNGKSVDYAIDLNAVSRGGAADQDVVLEPNDVIYVPQSLF